MNRSVATRLLGTLLTLFASLAWAQNDSALRTECLLLPLDVVEIAAERDGIIRHIHVRMGQQIAAQGLAFELDDEESIARLQLADAELERVSAKANNHAPLEVAASELKKSTKEAELLLEVRRVPYLERFRAEATREKNQAELKVAEATLLENQLELKSKQAEKLLAEMDVNRRIVSSPFAGAVTDELKHQGEYVQKGEGVLRVLRLDELRLQGIVNIKECAPHSLLMRSMTATFEMAGAEPIVLENLLAESVSAEVDLDGNYYVWTSIENRRVTDTRGRTHWILRPGMSGKLSISNGTVSQPGAKPMAAKPSSVGPARTPALANHAGSTKR